MRGWLRSTPVQQHIIEMVSNAFSAYQTKSI